MSDEPNYRGSSDYDDRGGEFGDRGYDDAPRRYLTKREQRDQTIRRGGQSAANPWDARAWLDSHPEREFDEEGNVVEREPVAEQASGDSRRDYRPSSDRPRDERKPGRGGDRGYRDTRSGGREGDRDRRGSYGRDDRRGPENDGGRGYRGSSSDRGDRDSRGARPERDGGYRDGARRDDRGDRPGRGGADRGGWRKNARDFEDRGDRDRDRGGWDRDRRDRGGHEDDRGHRDRPPRRDRDDRPARRDDRDYREARADRDRGYRGDREACADRDRGYRDDRPAHRDHGDDRGRRDDYRDRDYDRASDRDRDYDRDDRPERRSTSDREDPRARRMANPCPVAKRCGGCEWLAMPYEEQLERKQEFIEDLFGDYKCGVDGIMGMNDPRHYRNKVQLPFAPGWPNREGRIIPRWGIFERGTHHIVPCDDCVIEDERARPIIADVADLMPRYNIRAYDERAGDGWLRYCLVRTALVTGEVMLTFVATSKRIPAEKAFISELLDRHPEITTIVVNVNKERTSVILGDEERVVTGPGYIIDELCGCRFRISSSSFYQTNPIAAEALYDIAVDLAGLKPGDRIGDAYCGTGTIGIVAAKKSGAKLLGVERNPDAVDDARENAKINGIEDAEFVVGDAGSVFARMARAGETLDVVFMDPPRAGATQAFLANLCRLSPTRVVYISCEPKTQRHDITALLRNGYRVKQICPVDMFPHTDHVENIVLLERPLSQAMRQAERLRRKQEQDEGAAETDHSWLNADETTSYERGIARDEEELQVDETIAGEQEEIVLDADTMSGEGEATQETPED